jgi:hypothetical protein
MVLMVIFLAMSAEQRDDLLRFLLRVADWLRIARYGP